MVENIFCILDKLQMGLYNFGNILHIFIYNQHALPEHTQTHTYAYNRYTQLSEHQIPGFHKFELSVFPLQSLHFVKECLS